MVVNNNVDYFAIGQEDCFGALVLLSNTYKEITLDGAEVYAQVWTRDLDNVDVRKYTVKSAVEDYISNLDARVNKSTVVTTPFYIVNNTVYTWHPEYEVPGCIYRPLECRVVGLQHRLVMVDCETGKEL